MTDFTYICFVALAFIGLTMMFGGIGLFVRKLFCRGAPVFQDAALAPWVGWGATISFLQAWHLFRPVDEASFVVACLAGCAGILWNTRGLVRVASQDGRALRFIVGSMLLIALWLANQTAIQPQNYDSGYYYIQSMRWARSYPIVRGLGNLYCQYALNSSYFLYAAMLEVGIFAGRSHHLVSGLLIYWVMIKAIASVWDLVTRGRFSAPVIFNSCLIVPAVVFVMGIQGASSSPDVGVWAITLVVCSELLARSVPAVDTGLSDNGEVDHAEGNTYSLLAILLLCCIGVTVKLSFAASGLTAGLLILVLMARQMRRVYSYSGRIGVFRLLVWGTCIPLAVGLLWMVRGVILSGYPLYPSTFAGIDVDWAMPADVVVRNVAWIKSWARSPWINPEEVLGNWGWVKPWILRTAEEARYSIGVPLALALLGGPVMAYVTKVQVRRRPGEWLVLLVPISGILFWLVTAPDPRFGEAAFWALGLGVVSIVLGRSNANTAIMFVVTLQILLFVQNVNPVEFVRQWKTDTGIVKKAAMRPVRTLSGLTLYVPREGKQCWDASLPSAPFVHPNTSNLSLRVAGDLSGGFRLDGRARSRTSD